MSSKHTFLSLCNSYDKIEVPIIQRDYAQGRSTPDVITLRNRFINDYLISSLLSNTSIELDFVYGSIIIEENQKDKDNIFIPLDGQQRLTTLFLLHYFIAVKEGKLPEIKHLLTRFTYETRPSAHDFCSLLLNFDANEELENIKKNIEDANWFNNDWKKDSTIAGMLNMLDTFSSNKELMNYENILLERLLATENPVISFYYTDLNEFGLTENLYIRMNARGKMLTKFENFKSEFFKIISYNQELLEEVKDKIEYSWVDNLWSYREKETFIIDVPFMNLLSFITTMLYFKDAQYRSSVPYESDFLDFSLLKKIYSVEDNLRFLIYALDNIPSVEKHNKFIYWENDSLHDLLSKVMDGKGDVEGHYIVYSSFLFLFKIKNDTYLYDYLRVVRNLIHNTNDNSRREWPRLLGSLQKLISTESVYEVLYEDRSDDFLQGFLVSQRDEEIFKANLIVNFPDQKENIFKYEDNPNFKGRIRNLLLTTFAEIDAYITQTEFEDVAFSQTDFDLLSKIYQAYEIISKNNFKPVWGNLINSTLYRQTYDSRLLYNEDYRRNAAVLLFAKDFSSYMDSISLENFVVAKEKKFLKNLSADCEDFSTVRDVKIQLYIYYILHTRIYDKPFNTFFKNGYFNFGWLDRVSGYKSLFTNGIEGCKDFKDRNPIFQVYNQQFRYNLGINDNNTLDQEIVGNGNKRDPFMHLKQWAST